MMDPRTRLEFESKLPALALLIALRFTARILRRVEQVALSDGWAVKVGDHLYPDIPKDLFHQILTRKLKEVVCEEYDGMTRQLDMLCPRRFERNMVTVSGCASENDFWSQFASYFITLCLEQNRDLWRPPLLHLQEETGKIAILLKAVKAISDERLGKHP